MRRFHIEPPKKGYLLLGHDPVAERPQFLDDHLGRIPGPQGNHRCGNPGSDNVARHQGHPLAQVGDDLGDLEDQVSGVGIGDLPSLAIDAGPNGQVVRIGNIFFKGQIGPARGEGIQAFLDGSALGRVISLG